MRKGNPVQTLHEALGAALLRDLPDVHYETTDWEEVERQRKTLPAAEQRRAGGLPTKPAVRRPGEEDVDVFVFQQLWGSTALGYGGLGGAAMTYAYTVVVSTRSQACVYFGRGRLAYRVDLANLSETQRAAWKLALDTRSLPPQRQAKAAFGAKLPKD